MLQNDFLTLTYLPQIIKLSNASELASVDGLCSRFPNAVILDQFEIQKKELFKIRNPQKQLTGENLDALYKSWLGQKQPELEGVWVYYSWLNKIIHILDKDEFIELRTNRNNYKITPSEQQYLSTKTIGIIGLSVGHSVALTIATERICGKLKLADFDTLDLSNLNRIRTGIQNIGINKCIIAAREIKTIDPFFEIDCFTEGITAENINDFLLRNVRLDVLIDECDSLDIKVKARTSAKTFGIPVLMETSDKGMLDVERFDTEPDRPLFHGLLKDVPPSVLDEIQPQNRLPLTLKILNATNGSARGKASMLEMGRTINTWPQLASAVVLGGAVVTDVCRRLLLNQFTESGRYYIDLETLVPNTQLPLPKAKTVAAFDTKLAAGKIDLLSSTLEGNNINIEKSTLEKIVSAAGQAPSATNEQPWKWVWKNGRLWLFLDELRAASFANYENNTSFTSLGAAFQNLVLMAGELGYTASPTYYTPWQLPNPLLSVCFLPLHGQVNRPHLVELAANIYTRCTNRSPMQASEKDSKILDTLKSTGESINGATVQFFSGEEELANLGKIVGECDKIMMLHPEAHRDFFEKDVRWPGLNAENSKDGMDLRLMGMQSMEMAALSLLKDEKVVAALRLFGGGDMLAEAAKSGLAAAWAVGIITMQGSSSQCFFYGGMAMQYLWLQADALGVALQPLMSPLYLFQHISADGSMWADDLQKEEIISQYKDFQKITNVTPEKTTVFMFKVGKAAPLALKSKRLQLDDFFFEL